MTEESLAMSSPPDRTCWSCGAPAVGTTGKDNAFCGAHACEDCWSCGRPTTLSTVMGTPYCDGAYGPNGMDCKLVAIYSEMT